MSVTAEFPRRAQAPGRQKASLDIEALKHAFVEDGYLIFRDVVSKERLSSLRARIAEEFDRAKQSGRLFSGGGLISGHLNCFPGEGSRFAYEAL